MRKATYPKGHGIIRAVEISSESQKRRARVAECSEEIRRESFLQTSSYVPLTEVACRVAI